MQGLATIVVLSVLLAVGCATGEPAATPEDLPEVDSSGLVRIPAPGGRGSMYAHPTRAIDHYDDILVDEIGLTYAPGQLPLSEGDAQRLRMKAYDVVTRQIPAVGQLLAGDAGPCTVELGVELTALELAKGSREQGATTVILEFHDSVTGDPLVKFVQHRELDIPTSTREGADLERLETVLADMAREVRERLRDDLPLSATNARAGQGCKGTIGQAREQAQGR